MQLAPVLAVASVRHRQSIFCRAMLALFVTAGFAGMAMAGPAIDRVRIDPDRTSIRFEVPSVVWGTTRGEFRRFDGRLTIDFDRPARSAVQFTVDAASISTGSGAMDAYLKSDVLFNVAKFQQLRFVSQSVEKLDARTVSVVGELTMMGVTQTQRFVVDVEKGKRGGPALSFTARGKISRSAYGMDAAVPVVSDDVMITVGTEAEAPDLR